MTGRILIVDPIATNRILLGAMLNNAFFKTDFAASATEAAAVLKASPPDLVVVSDNERLEMLAAIVSCAKKSPLKSKASILLHAPALQATARTKALSLGADEIYETPIVERAFLAKLRCLLRRRETHVGIPDLSVFYGLAEEQNAFSQCARILVATSDETLGPRRKAQLYPLLPYSISHETLENAISELRSHTPPDLIVIEPAKSSTEAGLRLLAEVRARSSSPQDTNPLCFRARKRRRRD